MAPRRKYNAQRGATTPGALWLGGKMYGPEAPPDADARTATTEDIAAHDALMIMDGKAPTRPLVPIPAHAYRITEVLASNGIAPTAIAVTIGISMPVFENWLFRDPKFLSAYRRGKDVFETFGVERALANRALGYDYTEREVTTVELDGTLKDGTKVKVPATKTRVTNKHVPPDVNAITFYLKNRAANRWRDTKHHEVDATVKERGTMDLSKLNVEELRTLERMVAKTVEEDIEGEAFATGEESGPGSERV